MIIFDTKERAPYMDGMVQAKRVEIRLTPEHIAAIDAWRRHLPDLPPRAEAIVRLVEISLATEAKQKAKAETKK
jgi:hypothetical protein